MVTIPVQCPIVRCLAPSSCPVLAYIGVVAKIRGRAVSVLWRKCWRSVLLLNCSIWKRSGQRSFLIALPVNYWRMCCRSTTP